MKISHSTNSLNEKTGQPTGYSHIVLEAETDEENEYLFHYFKTEAKRLAKKFPRREVLN